MKLKVVNVIGDKFHEEFRNAPILGDVLEVIDENESSYKVTGGWRVWKGDMTMPFCVGYELVMEVVG